MQSSQGLLLQLPGPASLLWVGCGSHHDSDACYWFSSPSSCFSHRTSISSATRRLLSTWVALTTMQRKWRDHHPSSSFSPPTNRPTDRSTNQASERRERPGLRTSVDFESPSLYIVSFYGSETLKVNITATRTTKTTTNNNHDNMKPMSNSKHTHWPVSQGGAGLCVCVDCPCVIHILTSVFQCEGRIITWVLWSANFNMKPVKYKRLLNRNCDTICVQKIE